MDLGEARSPDGPIGEILPETTWIEPVPDGLVVPEGDPAAVAESRETIRLAFVAALQHLPPRQRAALILCEVLHWKAAEVAELLDTSVAAVNSALQRARATLDSAETADAGRGALSEDDRELLGRYVEAFQRYDMDALTALIHEDATQSMPPYELWLRGREDIFALVGRPGRRLSRLARDRRRRPPTARRRSPSTSRARTAARAMNRGRCRCSRSPTARSSR